MSQAPGKQNSNRIVEDMSLNPRWHKLTQVVQAIATVVIIGAMVTLSCTKPTVRDDLLYTQ